MARSDAVSVMVDNEGFFEVELAVLGAVVGLCDMEDPDWPYLEVTLNLSPAQANSLLRELSREVTLALGVTALDERRAAKDRKAKT